MMLNGQVPTGSKIVKDNIIVEQLNTFTYLGWKLYTKRKKYNFKKQVHLYQFLQFWTMFWTKFIPKRTSTEST